MQKKKLGRRTMQLHRETLYHLTPDHLADVAGAASRPCPTSLPCPTCFDTCAPCPTLVKTCPHITTC